MFVPKFDNTEENTTAATSTQSYENKSDNFNIIALLGLHHKDMVRSVVAVTQGLQLELHQCSYGHLPQHNLGGNVARFR